MGLLNKNFFEKIQKENIMICLKYLILLIIGISLQSVFALPASQSQLEKDLALEFLSEDHGLSRQKRFIYTGKEQRREAKENYEEKCERSALSRLRGKPRWCPELYLWDEWMHAVRKDGVKYGKN